MASEPVILDVTEFGAVGDGVADDATAVLAHACFADFDGFRHIRPRFDPEQGAVLFLPAGTYRLGTIDGYDRHHSFPFSRFHVRGEGIGRTTILLDHVANPHVRLSIHGDPRFGGGADVSIRDLTVASTLPRPPDRTSADMNIHVRDLNGFVAERVEVCDGPRIGFHVNSCTDVVIRDCHVHRMCTDGIHVVGCRRVAIEQCHLADTGDDAIAVWGGNWWNPHQSADVTVRGNRIERAGSNGIALGGCDRVVVEDNDVVGTYLTGIGIRPMANYGPIRGVTIRGNRVHDAGFHDEGYLWGGGVASGIAVADDLGTGVGITGVRVVGNELGRCRNNFLRVRGARDVRLVENRLLGPLVPGPSPNQGSGHGSANVDPGNHQPICVEDSDGVVVIDHVDGWRRAARRIKGRRAAHAGADDLSADPGSGP